MSETTGGWGGDWDGRRIEPRPERELETVASPALKKETTLRDVKNGAIDIAGTAVEWVVIPAAHLSMWSEERAKKAGTYVESESSEYHSDRASKAAAITVFGALAAIGSVLTWELTPSLSLPTATLAQQLEGVGAGAAAFTWIALNGICTIIAANYEISIAAKKVSETDLYKRKAMEISVLSIKASRKISYKWWCATSAIGDAYRVASRKITVPLRKASQKTHRLYWNLSSSASNLRWNIYFKIKNARKSAHNILHSIGDTPTSRFNPKNWFKKPEGPKNG